MSLSTIDTVKNSHRCGYPERIRPDSSLIFRTRARRFAALAEGHSLAGWLAFLGRISEAQHRVLQDYPPLALPDDSRLTISREDNMPLLSAGLLPRDPVWREALVSLIDDILLHAPAPARKALRQLQALSCDTLEKLADQILRREPHNKHLNFLPYIAAALQVHFTALAAVTDRVSVPHSGATGACPSCGFLPVGSVVRTDGEIPNLRYLHCGLCNTQWHLVRVTCAACGENGRGIAYHYIEKSNGAVRAETCDVCKSYLKIIYGQDSPAADPVADDLATLPLDLLLEEAGYHRLSPNLLLAQSSQAT